MKEHMKLEIIGYLESKTNEDKLWIGLDEMFIELNPHIRNADSDISEMEWIATFNETLTDMVMSQELRVNQENDKSILISLESIIQKKINGIKKTAIQQMKDELNKYVATEEYEKAAEYRDLINKYESKL